MINTYYLDRVLRVDEPESSDKLFDKAFQLFVEEKREIFLAGIRDFIIEEKEEANV